MVLLKSENDTSYDCATSAMEMPEFERILDDLGNLVNRLRSIRETSVTISDALIGVQNTRKPHDDCVKPDAPNYFVMRCTNKLNDLRDEVEYLRIVNEKLLHSIKAD